MDMNEFKVMCKNDNSILGYTDKSIQKTFGDLIYGEDDVNTLKELLDELNIKRNYKNLNDRLLMAPIVLETLCDLLDTGVVTHEDLEDMIKENVES